MSKIKPIIIILVLLVITFVYLTYFKNKPADPTISLESIDTVEISSSTVETNTPTAISANTSIKDKAWETLQKYLNFAKTRDIEGVRSLSYQLTDSCKNYTKSEENKKDCDAKMDTVAFFGTSFVKKDFVEVWSDSKQIILATDFRIEENEEAISRTRSIIYFVVDDGVIKMLKFEPAKGSILQKEGLTKAEIDKRLLDFTEDSDKDGAEDYLENCLSKSQDTTCVKTDTTKRDTDLDGFWDGIEVLFYK